jgi:hypothetical protein
MGIYRGMINIFNTNARLLESLIFAFAGYISGIVQFRLLKPHFYKRFYWILASAAGWAFLILATYPGIFALVLGAIFYGSITGLAFYKLMKPKILDKNLP